MKTSNFTVRIGILFLLLITPYFARAGGGTPVQVYPIYQKEQKIFVPEIQPKFSLQIQVDQKRDQVFKSNLTTKELEKVLRDKDTRFSIGTNSGGGGTDKGLAFKKVVYDALANLRTKFPDVYDSLKKHDLEKFTGTVTVLFVEAELEARLGPYFQESAALNLRDSNTVLVSRTRWEEIREPVFREGIGLHEILSLKNIEGTGRYSISEKYVTALGYSSEQFIDMAYPKAKAQRAKLYSDDGKCILGFHNPTTFKLCKGERYYYIANPKLRVAYFADLLDFKSPIAGTVKFQSEYAVEVNPLQDLGKGEGCASRPSDQNDNVCVGDIVKSVGIAKKFSDLEVLAVFDNRSVVVQEKNCASGCTYWENAFYLSSLEYEITSKNPTYRNTRQTSHLDTATDLTLDDLCPSDGQIYVTLSDAKLAEVEKQIAAELRFMSSVKSAHSGQQGQFTPQNKFDTNKTACLWPTQFLSSIRNRLTTAKDPSTAHYYAALGEKAAKIQLEIIGSVPLKIYRPSFFDRFLISTDTGVCEGRTIYVSAKSEQRRIFHIAEEFVKQGAKVIHSESDRVEASVTWTRAVDKACAEKVEKMAWYTLGSEKGNLRFYQESPPNNKISSNGEIFFNY